MTPPAQALQILKEGNARFVTARTASSQRSHKLIQDQEPFAIIIGCSDSRVPPEIVFDQGVGDMFVIRVAGNIITPLELGSVEFAALKFGPRLVIVMGHTKCGAVQSTIETVQAAPSPDQASEIPGLSEGMQIIVGQISASVDPSCSCDEISDNTIRANIANSVRKLRTESQVLINLKASEGFMIVGALYHIETGEVEFLDED